jgi:hypothetical protein
MVFETPAHGVAGLDFRILPLFWAGFASLRKMGSPAFCLTYYFYHVKRKNNSKKPLRQITIAKIWD